MITRLFSAALRGVEAQEVEVEANAPEAAVIEGIVLAVFTG
jgi:hypothetical protein